MPKNKPPLPPLHAAPTQSAAASAPLPNNPNSGPTDAPTPGADGTAPINATRACGPANPSVDADDPSINTHNGSEHPLVTAGAAATAGDTADDLD
ncbi:hypothetical protein MARA_07420 [Mycolicibacterium arabiense]|uniref:Uncharacterized protein n=1 Tax=Mycolicibacterium arabiense TaxID=1286181 RepID=A0A7I7RRU6_9MYCO|nr:hypothetical protein MARA_07420 [Mycolicibacterium arabiense]